MLTSRRRRILVMIAGGLDAKTMAETLACSHALVMKEVRALHVLFGTKTRGHLVAQAMRRGEIT